MSEINREAGNQFSFAATHKAQELRDAILANQIGEDVALGGRLMGIRDQGSLVFGDVWDDSGAIQVIADREKTADFSGFLAHSTGDWLGVMGQSGLTRRGEPSIFLNDWVTLAKTETPISAKQKITDPEILQRQRYLDLAVNQESMKRFLTRSKIVSLIRSELEEQSFVEVETPILQPVYGGAAARPFDTHMNALDLDLYMRIAPELYLKRLVVGGIQRVFEIGKDFRNEGVSTKHNPEFTMMEVYAAFWDYTDQMRLTQDLVAKVAQEVHGSTNLEYQGRELDLTPPWPTRTMDSLVSEAIGREITIDAGVDELRQLCDEHGIPYNEAYGPGKLLLELYEKLVEDDLWGPIFVTEYPKEVSPLARSHRDRPGYTERFEGIVGGRELCNGFSELNDPKEQYARFKDQETTSEYDDEAMHMDHDYVRALQYGLPPTAGLGIGIDRLVMLITDTPSIRDVILFPTLRPDAYKAKY